MHIIVRNTIFGNSYKKKVSFNRQNLQSNIHNSTYNILTLHLDTGRMGNKSQILKEPSLDLIEIFTSILIGHVCGADMQLEVRSKVLKVIIIWQLLKIMGGEGK